MKNLITFSNFILFNSFLPSILSRKPGIMRVDWALPQCMQLTIATQKEKEGVHKGILL